MLKSIRKSPKALIGKSKFIGFTLLFAGVGVAALLLTKAETPTNSVITTYPTAPPAQICGNAGILGAGPTTAPAGAVTVPAGDNSDMNFALRQANTTYWFEPGVHHFGAAGGQIIPGNNATFIGAPGAILDGQKISQYAFTQQATGVTIKYLTIQNFVGNLNEGVVNHDAGTGWTVSNNTIQNNGGAGLFIGTDNVVNHNCLKDNAQYGFSLYKPSVEGDFAIKNVTLDHNEIVGNNAADMEWNHDPTTGARTTPTNCGCTGAGKFWDVNGAKVTNNWVHNNKSVALWADTNNNDFLFEGNLIEDNDGEGIFYEISYNATIRYNTLRRNAWVKGQEDQGSPGAAIYLSESGGDSRLATPVTGSSSLNIHDNFLEDNFAGISVYENSNRFCNSKGNTSTAYCTPFVTPTYMTESPAGLPFNYSTPYSDTHPCYTQVANEPYSANCRWNAQNISIRNNQLNFDPAKVPCAGTLCGVMGLYATGSDNLTWSPYTTQEVQNNVMLNRNNKWSNNTYIGPWKFIVKFGGKDQIGWDRWRAPAPTLPYTDSAIPSGFGQDVASTCNGCPAVVDPPSGGGGTSATLTVPNHLDPETANLEATLGKWAGWFSANVTKSADKAQAGTGSLKVDVTAPYGWGVQLNNYPGFAATKGDKTISFWGVNGSGSNSVNMNVSWRKADGTVLQKDTITLGLNTAWQQAKADVVAPEGTAVAHVDFTSSTAGAGAFMYFDEIYVGERTGGGTTTPPPTDTTPPTAPSALTATATSATRADLRWTAATDNVGITKYYVVRNSVTVAELSGTTLAYADTSLSPSSKYDYYILATDAAGNISPASNTASTTTSALPDTVAPTAPANLTASAANSAQINLAWSASTDNVGVTSYDVYRNGIKVTTVTTTSYGDTGLSASTSYSYYVTARDAAGNTSPNSNTVSATTQAPVTNGSLSGTVSSSRGGALSGARVKLTVGGVSYTYSTNSSGTYQATNLPAGNYTVGYTAKNHIAQTHNVTVIGGANTTKNVTLQRR